MCVVVNRNNGNSSSCIMFNYLDNQYVFQKIVVHTCTLHIPWQGVAERLLLSDELNHRLMLSSWLRLCLMICIQASNTAAWSDLVVFGSQCVLCVYLLFTYLFCCIKSLSYDCFLIQFSFRQLLVPSWLLFAQSSTAKKEGCYLINLWFIINCFYQWVYWKSVVWWQDELNEEFQKKLVEHKEAAVSRTEKKRAKRSVRAALRTGLGRVWLVSSVWPIWPINRRSES